MTKISIGLLQLWQRPTWWAALRWAILSVLDFPVNLGHSAQGESNCWSSPSVLLGLRGLRPSMLKWYCINFDQETPNYYKAFLTTITTVLIIIIRKTFMKKLSRWGAAPRCESVMWLAIPEGSINLTITITMSSKTHTSPVEEQHQDASLWYDQPAQRWAPPTRTAHTLPGAGSEKNIAHIIRCWVFQTCFSNLTSKKFSRYLQGL